MSCIEYLSVEIEESMIEKGSEAPRIPGVVTGGEHLLGEQVARRAAAVLDAQLTGGSMPA